jgi:thiol-disulfide isomerase/thioredoxin
VTRARWLLVLCALIAAQLAFLALRGRIEEWRRGAAFPVHVERRSDPAFDLAVERFGGDRQTVPARSGEFQLIHFWATWCPPCRTELPAILELAERKRGRLQVWAVSTDRDWSSVQRFLKRRIPPEVVRDPTGSATNNYRVTGLPDSYLIDPDGRIRARFSGAQNWSAPEMDRLLKALLRS